MGTDYRSWTLDQINQLVDAKQQLHAAATAEERRQALRLIKQIHQDAEFDPERDAGGPSVWSFAAGFTGGR